MSVVSNYKRLRAALTLMMMRGWDDDCGYEQTDAGRGELMPADARVRQRRPTADGQRRTTQVPMSVCASARGAIDEASKRRRGARCSLKLRCRASHAESPAQSHHRRRVPLTSPRLPFLSCCPATPLSIQHQRPSEKGSWHG